MKFFNHIQTGSQSFHRPAKKKNFSVITAGQGLHAISSFPPNERNMKFLVCGFSTRRRHLSCLVKTVRFEEH